MTAVLDRVERPEPPAPAATRALAWAEARRLWHSPFYWGGTVLAIALGVVWAWTRMPTWDTFHQNAGMSSLVLGAAMLMATHLAAGRDHRAGAEECTSTMPAGSGRRGLALLVAVPVSGVTGAAAYLLELLLLMPAWPVGRFDPWAAGAVVVIPAIGAAIGVAVGRVLPGAAAGPLTVVALAAMLLSLLALPSYPKDFPDALWPVPDVPWEVGADRPTGWHLAYLCGVLLAIIAVIVWRSRPLFALLVVVPAVMLSGAAVQQQVQRTVVTVHPEDEAALTGVAVLDCRTYREVRYCALPHYAGWTGLWRKAVEPVATRLPADATRPAVRQLGSMDDMVPMVPGQPEIITSTVWGRTGAWAESSRLQMTSAYAAAAVGLTRRDAFLVGSCDGAGQHRTVVALWLIGQAGPESARRRLESGDLRLPMVRYGPDEVRAARDLLGRPREEVAGYLAMHWDELLDPSGTALAGLGVTITPPPIPTTPDVAGPDVAGPDAPGLRDAGVCR
ncbi:hypothetical protein [Actinoplanes sp. GCM10030250]|uniref:hypothetical protein n=1 Tax=Actinoplanes sp. GCM10030250 TaxID=3273376 RepID=UPI0036202EE3